jgi:hypothetical protein
MVVQALKIFLRPMAQKADTRVVISSMGKKASPVLTAAGESFAVSKANAAHLCALPVRLVGSGDKSYA